MTGWYLCTAGRVTGVSTAHQRSCEVSGLNSSLPLENYLENLIIEFITSAISQVGRQGGTWLCGCPAPTHQIRGKGQSQSPPGLFQQEKKVGLWKEVHALCHSTLPAYRPSVFFIWGVFIILT